ncbi:MAG: hypothetical protein ACOCXZ_03060 [Chloroflexota bacterium]
MTWTTPKTWLSEPLTSVDLNTYVRDNQNALKHPPTVSTNVLSTFSTTSTAYVDVPDSELTIVTTGGDVMVSISGGARNTGGGGYAGVRLDATDYDVLFWEANNWHGIGCAFLLRDVAPGSHTVRLRLRAIASTASLWVTQFWVREVS